ncbi:MAG TPA: hypothetical protein VF524_15660 [Polyangia bacterium]
MCASLPDFDQPSFTVAIRWRGSEHSVDLETRHPGFRDRVEAARFAAGVSNTSPQRLRLRPDGISLLLGQQGYVDFPYDLITVWIRPRPDAEAFEARRFCDLEAWPSAPGNYRRVGYAVLGPGGSPVSLVIDFDNADRLSITVDKQGGSHKSGAVRTP